MWESRPHSRAMARDMTVVDAPVSTQARRRLLFFLGGEGRGGGCGFIYVYLCCFSGWVGWGGCVFIYVYIPRPVSFPRPFPCIHQSQTQNKIPVVDAAVDIKHLLLRVQLLVHSHVHHRLLRPPTGLHRRRAIAAATPLLLLQRGGGGSHGDIAVRIPLLRRLLPRAPEEAQAATAAAAAAAAAVRPVVVVMVALAVAAAAVAVVGGR